MNIDEELLEVTRKRKDLELIQETVIEARRKFSHKRIQQKKSRNNKWMEEMTEEVSKFRCPVSDVLILELNKNKRATIPS